ncbi:hypothetical protein [Aquimarina aquimarini]|uniref:hypothetical protein n=1 Tax=Aquimarina aquimarini TaxID=1191734 RepID=UPI000D5568D2|nr:hypothetical protein [Aquimarina aquimarini]
MELLQQLTKKKEEITEVKNGVAVNPIDKTNQASVAYEDSKACGGRTPNLKASLETLYEQFFTKIKADGFEQQQLKQPYITETESLEEKLAHKEEEIKKVTQEQDSLQSQINALHQESILAIKNPETLEEIKPKSNIKLWMGLVFLIPLSAYIFIFYISTAYSSFFKVFDPNISLFHTIFEPKAIERAFEAGWMEAGFVILIPFVFFSLGYLIHMFWSQNKISSYIKVGALLIITLSFDVILAYLIDQKEYNFNKTPESPEFTISMALESPTFWLIIFAGFVSYFIWGLVFDTVMIENAKRDTMQFFRKNHQEKVKQKNKLLGKTKQKLDNLEEESETYKVRLKELACIIEGFILPIQNYKVFAIAYLKGWQKYIAAELPMGQEEKINLLEECGVVYQSHIKSLDLEADDYQNKIYTTVL